MISDVKLLNFSTANFTLMSINFTLRNDGHVFRFNSNIKSKAINIGLYIWSINEKNLSKILFSCVEIVNLQFGLSLLYRM